MLPIPIPPSQGVHIPFFSDPVSAGFPSPAQDSHEDSLDLQRLLVRRPAATFSICATGNSMSPTIWAGDRLIVDRSIDPHHNDIVIVACDGAFTVKRLFQSSGVQSLIPDNIDYSPLDITTGSDFLIWGVVTGIVRLTCTR